MLEIYSISLSLEQLAKGGQVMAIRMKKEREGRGYEWIEVHSVHEVKVVIAYNKEIEKQRKRDNAFHSRCVSMDQLLDEHDFEFASNEKSMLDRLIEEEERIEKRKILDNAIDQLTDMQQFVIRKYFWEEKTFRAIAKERGVSHKAIHKSYELAIKKLRKLLEKEKI